MRGEQLSCVIIDKLPFAVPTDPIVAARQRYIEDEGGSSFFEYSVPQAIISLKQGLGRLIRSTTDRGVLAVLDPRLKTKSYGRLFLKSLPQCRVTSDIEELAHVFETRPRWRDNQDPLCSGEGLGRGRERVTPPQSHSWRENEEQSRGQR